MENCLQECEESFFNHDYSKHILDCLNTDKGILLFSRNYSKDFFYWKLSSFNLEPKKHLIFIEFSFLDTPIKFLRPEINCFTTPPIFFDENKHLEKLLTSSLSNFVKERFKISLHLSLL